MTTVSPAPELTQLAFFSGTWEGEGAFLHTEFGPAATQPLLRVEAAFRHRGHWLEQRFMWVEVPQDGPAATDVVEATRLWGYDQSADRFTCEWFDNRGRRATVVSPGWEGDRLVATAVIADAGRQVQARETFTRNGDDEWTHVAEVNFGKGWIANEEQTLRRISGP